MFINFFGVVTETFEDHTAEVVVGKPSEKGNLLKEAQKSNKMRVKAKNSVYARKGDLVNLTLRREITKSEIVYTYILPIALFFMVFLSLNYGIPSFAETNIPFLFGIGGLFIGVVIYGIKRKTFSKTYIGNIKRVRSMDDLKKFDKYNF